MEEKPSKREYVSMKLLPEIIAAVDALAGQENRSRSNMIEVLLREALAAREGMVGPEGFRYPKMR